MRRTVLATLLACTLGGPLVVGLPADADGRDARVPAATPPVLSAEASASRAPTATVVGEVADVPTSANERCTQLTAVQSASAPDRPGYVIPHDGVLTSWRHRDFAFEDLHSEDAMLRAVVMRPTGTAHNFTLTGRSEPRALTSDVLNTFPTRVPVEAGDVLGLSWKGTKTLNCAFAGSPGDQYVYRFQGSFDPDTQTDFTGFTFGTNLRTNIAGVVEPDTDGDGYGDVSQDQCPTRADTQGPCGAYAVGEVAPPGAALYGCEPLTATQLATDPGRRGYVVPVDGVLTGWSHQDILFTQHSTDEQVRALLLRPAGQEREFTVTGRTPAQSLTDGDLNSFQARVRVRAGDVLGLTWDGTGALACSYGGSAGDQYGFAFHPDFDPDSTAPGTFEPFGPNLRTNVAAVVERDADRDGYGDVSQDRCPTQAIPGGGPCDRTAPQTRVVARPPARSVKRTARFRFASSETRSTFQCSIDGTRFRACGATLTRTVKPGRHALKVRATDRWGNRDRTPAVVRWRVLKRR